MLQTTPQPPTLIPPLWRTKQHPGECWEVWPRKKENFVRWLGRTRAHSQRMGPSGEKSHGIVTGDSRWTTDWRHGILLAICRVAGKGKWNLPSRRIEYTEALSKVQDQILAWVITLYSFSLNISHWTKQGCGLSPLRSGPFDEQETGHKRKIIKKSMCGEVCKTKFLYPEFSCFVISSFFFSSQHWIRIELYPDLLIQRLAMTVDPSDSSYMPSVVVISAGDSIQSLKEIKTVHISATESQCTLLEDVQRVRYSVFSQTLLVPCLW